MDARAVGAGHEIRGVGRQAVDDHHGVVRADGRAVAGLHAGGADLVGLRRPQPADGLDRVHQLRLVHLEVAAHDGRDESAIAGHEEGGLGRARGRHIEEGGEGGDGLRPGRFDLLGRHRLLGAVRGDAYRGDLLVGGVAAGVAQHQRVLAVLVEEHELVCAAAAHDPDV